MLKQERRLAFPSRLVILIRRTVYAKDMGSTIILEGVMGKELYRNGDFSIHLFKTTTTVNFPNGKPAGKTISIKGDFLPAEKTQTEISGNWDPKLYKGRYTFVITDCKVTRIREKKAIIGFLKTLEGVGPATAERIFSEFRLNTFDVLDQDISKLKDIESIGPKKYETIAASYIRNMGAGRELSTFLQSLGCHSKNKLEILYRQYGQDAVEEIKGDPFGFFLDGFISFSSAEQLFREGNLDPMSYNRICAHVYRVLENSQAEGNTFMLYKPFLVSTLNLLGYNSSCPKKDAIRVATKIHDCMKEMEDVYCSYTADNVPFVTLKRAYWAEQDIAKSVQYIMQKKQVQRDYQEDILAAEKTCGLRLSKEQEEAVQMAMNSSFSIVTGGPGTGKTTFQKILMEVFLKYNKDKAITLAAPTGRAARRMSENADAPASTLHQLLNLIATDDGETLQVKEAVHIPDGLVIVDECSMLDVYLASEFFSAVIHGRNRIVFIGDVDQLPSVGPGSVLKSIIDSGSVPVKRFTKIFRQEAGSCIAENACKIRLGDTKHFQFDKAFQFLTEEFSDRIVEETKRQFKAAVDEFGIDEVTVLTPFRRKTSTGVNELNPVLKQAVNPFPEKKSTTNKIGGKEIYVGDKVMFTRNKSGLANGDIGYVQDIKMVEGMQVVLVDFGGDPVVLSGDELDFLVPAYATTIHKSQGSEYACCIIVVDPRHSRLLTRNVLYTAVSRAKKRCILIGSFPAFCKGVETTNSIERDTMLTEMLRQEDSGKTEKEEEAS